MSAKFGLSWDDLGVRKAFAAARARGLDLRPAFRSMARAGVAQARRRFLNGRAPDGTPWKPSRKASGQTLIGKGLLLRSISDRPPTHAGVEWGSNRIYAGVHNDGAIIRAKTAKGLRFRVGSNGGWVVRRQVEIPKRTFLGANDQDKAEFGDIGLRYVADPLLRGAL
ncbi:phage virion morphogenesis protein [Phenylobacterium sp. 58.2.17]|uniref:phage virion morphogenesis protein n=1 Tax=Phenylobacterium sp. 58.2.17 TaxID=2969306 RepID=UPI002264623F|nr:phage virion morphogenesis protein [Phenylobacterium sp. 58.2.17]MCX7586543.1 phage virion morphogenesis protein [Phenylobacterium sp. 58.2.17]